MLFGLIVLLASATPEAAVSAEDHETSLHLLVSAGTGMSIFNSVNSSRGLVTTVRAGVMAMRPPLVLGGSRLGFGAELFGRQDFGLHFSEWGGSVSVWLELAFLRIVTAVGYGLSSTDFAAPVPLIDVRTAVGIPLGPFVIGAALDTVLRPVGDSRSLQVLGTVTWMPVLRREALPGGE